MTPKVLQKWPLQLKFIPKTILCLNFDKSLIKVAWDGPGGLREALTILFLTRNRGAASGRPQRGRPPSAAAPFGFSILGEKHSKNSPGEYFWSIF